MKSIDELGALVKVKYPQYRNMEDAEVGRLVQVKYPGAYDDFVDPFPMLVQMQELTEK